MIYSEIAYVFGFVFVVVVCAARVVLWLRDSARLEGDLSIGDIAAIDDADVREAALRKYRAHVTHR